MSKFRVTIELDGYDFLGKPYLSFELEKLFRDLRSCGCDTYHDVELVFCAESFARRIFDKTRGTQFVHLFNMMFADFNDEYYKLEGNPDYGELLETRCGIAELSTNGTINGKTIEQLEVKE